MPGDPLRDEEAGVRPELGLRTPPPPGLLDAHGPVADHGDRERHHLGEPGVRLDRHAEPGPGTVQWYPRQPPRLDEGAQEILREQPDRLGAAR